MKSTNEFLTDGPRPHYVVSAVVSQPVGEVARVEAEILFQADEDHPSILDRQDHVNVADIIHAFNNCAHVAIERLGLPLSKPRIASEQSRYSKSVVPGQAYQAVLVIHTMPTRKVGGGLIGGRASFLVVGSGGSTCASLEVVYADVK